jgi:hypothetical protein
MPTTKEREGPGGCLVVGSGKPEIPCARMHCEMASMCALTRADGGPVDGPPPGSSCWQAVWAALKDGENGLIPDCRPMRILKPPPPDAGSGKLGTPWERMHSENFSPWL